MVAIHLNANYVFVEPMKNQTGAEFLQAYQIILNRMKTARLGLKTHQLDNEASQAYKDAIASNGMKYKLVPPGNHKQNQAERVIQAFKVHFIAILAGDDNKFPLSLWCYLLEPTELTLNLLPQSKIVLKISACAHVHGPHD
jgi:hypothetical protein